MSLAAKDGCYRLVRNAEAIAFFVLTTIATMSQGSNHADDLAPSIDDDALIARLHTHIATLAQTIGERNVFRPAALEQAANYIEKVWRGQNYEVSRYAYQARGENAANLEITQQGKSEEIVLVGAHYDSVFGSPGANDNGSGVAAMLELSRHLAGEQPKHTVRFVAFVNEELPFFKTDSMGSRVYADMARERGDNIRAMLCLETIGYYSEVPDSQRYPPLFNLFYPDKGNFIGFVSDFQSRSLLKRSVAAFRAASDFPIEYVTTFGFIPGVDWSDHWSFWREGIPAIMITDTAPYRYPHYHTPQDTPDKVNYPRLANLTQGLLAVVNAIANAE